MANLMAIHSLGNSLVTVLRNAYPEPLRTDLPCEFRLICSGELADPGELTGAITLYLYRIGIDAHLRNGVRRPRAGGRVPLGLDLHYLVTAWADSALAEHAFIAWVMFQLNRNPVLDRSSLSADGGWGEDEEVQIVPAEMSNEDMMRIWDSLAPTYRLSVPYVARVVRIEPEEAGGDRPVVATRFAYGGMPEAEDG